MLPCNSLATWPGSFATPVKFETTFGISDEQYVRNVVDTLYRKAVASRAGARQRAGVRAAEEGFHAIQIMFRGTCRSYRMR